MKNNDSARTLPPPHCKAIDVPQSTNTPSTRKKKAIFKMVNLAMQQTFARQSMPNSAGIQTDGKDAKISFFYVRSKRSQREFSAIPLAQYLFETCILICNWHAVSAQENA
jgi:hypothetical protein